MPCVGCVGVVLGGRCWHSPFPLAMACCDSRPGFCCLKSPSVVYLPSFRHPPLGHKWKYVAWNGSPRKDHEIRIPVSGDGPLPCLDGGNITLQLHSFLRQGLHSSQTTTTCPNDTTRHASGRLGRQTTRPAKCLTPQATDRVKPRSEGGRVGRTDRSWGRAVWKVERMLSGSGLGCVW